MSDLSYSMRIFHSVCRLASLLLELAGLHGLSICATWAHLPRGIWILSYLTRDRTQVPCLARQILNHWTTREVPLNRGPEC